MLQCRICWNRAGGMCIQCGNTKAQTEKQYMHRCKGCVAGVSAEAHFRVVREKSEAYLQQTSVHQQWTGNEPALQLLLLPDSTSPLPVYWDTPE